MSDWSDYNISKPLLKSLAENGWSKPLKIQEKSLKASLIDGKNVLGAAQTGSGKTIAYALPMLVEILRNRDKPCSLLMSRIRKHHKKNEDFELIDGKMVEIEEMIVDKLDNKREGSDESEASEGDFDDCANNSCPEAIVLVPTRELALQVSSEVEKLCKYTKLHCCCVIGGLSHDKQIRILKNKRPEIIIATPGRLYDIVESDQVEHLNMTGVASIRTLIIDEADRIVQKGHFEEVLKIIDILKASKKFRREEFPLKIHLFSATLTFLHELPDRLRVSAAATSKESKAPPKKVADVQDHTKKSKIIKTLRLLNMSKADTRVIDLTKDSLHGRPNSDQLTEFKINCVTHEKDLFLYYFLVENPNKRVLVFCNSKDCLRRLSNVLKFLGHHSLTLHADMDQKKRLSSLEKFRKNPNSIMIATDVAARGLDISNLECVVHYQVPRTCESYIHRSGRTARLLNKGVSLTLCEPKEVPFYKRICNNINEGEDIQDYDVNTNLKRVLKQRVSLAQECDKLEHYLRESKTQSNWFVKAAKQCEIELDEDELRHLTSKGKSNEENSEILSRQKQQLSHMTKQLKTLLKKPLPRARIHSTPITQPIVA